ncbi:pre-mRNA-processing factor 39 [Marchantia polymorpha subsp. ruderalis]|nr:hypothetical protein MARPO_0104s0010 [Marchantia polymorpha]PTQ31974.1 hypothetical protein MARPO_0104s0010 [Marchantia polymorpha]BBN13071.1 hypothetical protein Mp_6g00560 [Marchantia polymorpha subsp. ruderalis]BBN13072.1 hypothetical protein Mp_6g00560 [Marchantia polymorpha subsp. ruderalis]|eukprot:PTQ31973.1 hypothetical protein MARPO_0104s0010 [Marchantia polymorpha]
MGDQEFAEQHVEMAVADEPMEDAAMVDIAKKGSPEHGGEANGSAEPVEISPEELPAPEEPAPTTEEDRLWAVVKANSLDFNAWTLLIQETEKLENILKIRKVYDSFLGEFPLCYGYWKKYADHEARLGTPEKIVEVYERAVRAVTYSVDIWMHYCSYAMEKIEDPEEIRRLFERGITYVGTDYLSHLLWDKYIDFEYTQQEWSRLAQLYTRIVQISLHQLDRYYNSFKQIASSRPISELRSADEAAEAAIAASSTVETAAAEDGVEAPPGDTEAPKLEKSTETEDLEKFIGVREALYKKAKDWDAKIRDFETAIRRPYFHVKPLDDMQLGNWHRYLEFIEKEGDTEKVVKLYERCLIACANYPEYWIRYVQRMEEEGNMEAAADALTRSTEIFVKRRPEIHLFAARFKEFQGDIKGARAEYELLSSDLAPGLLEAVIKHANFEHRQGNPEAATSLFVSAIEAEKAKEESRALPLLYIQYARFLDQIIGRTDQAREVYMEAVSHLPTSKVLWEAVIHFESIHAGEKRVPRLDSLVEQATAPFRPDGSQGLSAADREELSSIYLELVDLFGDVATVKKAEQRHKTLFPPRKSSSESKKRPSPESGSVAERAKVHKPYAGAHTVASPAPAPPAYANGQVQWGGGYGPQGYAQQPQGWQPPPQAPPVQPQQWNPGYGGQQDVQGGYGGYGGYAAYGPPQQQPPPQQPAGYGGYQGYPPQEFPQQPGYAQSAPTYRSPPPPAPPQPLPPTAQQAGYYAGYY